jgi:hypothetical protein
MNWVVAPDAPVRAEDEELEPDAGHLAVGGNHLPVELDDVGDALDVVPPPEAEGSRGDELLVAISCRRRKASGSFESPTYRSASSYTSLISNSSLVFVVAADPELPRLTLVAALRCVVEDRVVSSPVRGLLLAYGGRATGHLPKREPKSCAARR